MILNDDSDANQKDTANYKGTPEQLWLHHDSRLMYELLEFSRFG